MRKDREPPVLSSALYVKSASEHDGVVVNSVIVTDWVPEFIIYFWVVNELGLIVTDVTLHEYYVIKEVLYKYVLVKELFVDILILEVENISDTAAKVIAIEVNV